MTSRRPRPQRWRPETLRTCVVVGCGGEIPYRTGEGRRYEQKLLCPAHVRTVVPARRAPWRDEQRPCARTRCDATFTPSDRRQKYCTHACAVAVRTDAWSETHKEQAKTCTCGCGEIFARTPGLTDANWEGRRFKNQEHRLRASGSSRSPRTPRRSARSASTKKAAKPELAPVPPSADREVWRPASWGGPYRVAT